MNIKAREIGCTGSNFVNPHGAHEDNHYTTAYDLYLMFNEALKYGTTVQELVRLNNIKNPNLIYVNQMLRIE